MWLLLPCTWHPTNRNSSWRQVWSSTAGCLERSSRFALLGLGFGLQAFSQQAFEVQPLAAEAEVAIFVPGPLILGAVPGQLQAVAVGISQVQGLVGAVIVDAVKRPPGLGEASKGVTQRGSRRVEDRDVIQAGRAGGRGRADFRLPRVEAEVVVIAACRQEQRVWHAKDHVKSKDVDIEVVHAVDVGCLEVDVADSGSRSDRARRRLPRGNAWETLILDFCLHIRSLPSYYVPQSLGGPRTYDCDLHLRFPLAPTLQRTRTAADGSLFDVVRQMSLDWTPGRVPPRKTLTGATVRLEPLDPEGHALPLFQASHDGGAGEPLFRYLPYGPFLSFDDFKSWLRDRAVSSDPYFVCVVEAGIDSPQGMAAFMRMAPEHCVIEIGHIWFSPALQRTRMATEAIYLMARHSFDDLG